MRDYLRIAFDRVPISADTRTPIIRLAQKCISLPARWRLDHSVYRFPVELWLNKKLKERTAALKPAVDAKRLEPTRWRPHAEPGKGDPLLPAVRRASARRPACACWPSLLLCARQTLRSW